MLELIATFDGGALKTESRFQMLSFLPQERKAEALGMAAGLFVALGFVMVLSMIQIVGVIEGARAGDEWSVWDLFEVAYDVGQVILIIYYGIVVLDVNFHAEVQSGQLVQGILTCFIIRANQVYMSLSSSKSFFPFGSSEYLSDFSRPCQRTVCGCGRQVSRQGGPILFGT